MFVYYNEQQHMVHVKFIEGFICFYLLLYLY